MKVHEGEDWLFSTLCQSPGLSQVLSPRINKIASAQHSVFFALKSTKHACVLFSFIKHYYSYSFFKTLFIRGTDAEAETPILWPPDAKNWLTRKDPDAGQEGRQEKKTFKGPIHALLHSVPPTQQQVTTNPRFRRRFLDTHGHVWVSFLWGHCSFLLGLCVHKVLFVPSKSLFPQSCVSSGGSMMGLMATSSKRAYAIPRSTVPRALPLQQATIDPYLHSWVSSVAQSCPTLHDSMNHSTPGLPVHHQLPEFTQTHVHWVSDAIQPSHPLSSPSPPAPNPSQHQSLFHWVNSSHEVAKVLEFQP